MKDSEKEEILLIMKGFFQLSIVNRQLSIAFQCCIILITDRPFGF